MATRTPDRFVTDDDGGGGSPDHVIIDGQPVDVNVTGGNITLNASDIEIGAVELKNGTDDTRAIVTAANALKVDGSAVTQPISAATLPLPAGAATAANQQTDALTDAELRATPVDVNIASGTVTVSEPVTVDATDLDIRNLAFATDKADVSGSTVTIQEPLSIDDNGGSITVDGAVSVSNFPVTQDTNLKQINGNTVNAGSGLVSTGTQRVVLATDQPVIPVSDNGASLTVDGTVAVSAVGGTVAVTQSTSPWVVSGTVTASGDHTVVGKAADGAAVSGNPVLVAGQDGTNAQSVRTDTTGNVGTYWKTGSVALGDAGSNTVNYPMTESGAAIVPVVMPLNFNGSTWDRQRGNATDGTLVNLGANNDVTVTSGAITETNSAAIAASLSVLDDWDESDRAKVNPIVGQAGVQGGSGAVNALTQRVVLATDQPVVPISDNGGSLTVDGAVTSAGLVDTANSVATTVANGANTGGSFVDFLNYGSLAITLKTDAAVLADQTVAIAWSDDGVNTQVTQTFEVTGELLGGSIIAPTLSRYARVRYTNNSGGTRTIRLSNVARPATAPAATTYGFNTYEQAASPGVFRSGDVWKTNNLGFGMGAVTNEAATNFAGVAADGDYAPVSVDRKGRLGVQPLPAGTNNIGDVDIASAIPAGTNYIGRTDGYNGVIKDNAGTDSTVKFAHLDMSTATTTDIVAAVPGKTIRVLSWFIGTSTNALITTVNFARGAGTTRCTGSPRFTTGVAGHPLSEGQTAATQAGLFETADGEALRVTQTGANTLSIAVSYIEVN